MTPPPVVLRAAAQNVRTPQPFAGARQLLAQLSWYPRAPPLQSADRSYSRFLVRSFAIFFQRTTGLVLADSGSRGPSWVRPRSGRQRVLPESGQLDLQLRSPGLLLLPPMCEEQWQLSR